MKQTKFLIAMALMCGFTSCSNEEPLLALEENPPVESLSDSEIQQKSFEAFARILSKAAYSSPELRQFLKETAQKRIDNAYTVFYPLVKNEMVGERTFRELLREFDNNGELEEIETNLPLLNIHFPSVGLASVETLDVTDDELPALFNNNIYLNGEIVDELSWDEVPGYNVMLLDNSFTIELSSARGRADSRLLGGQYAYTDDFFNPEVNPRPKTSMLSRTTTSGPYYDDPNPKYDEAGIVPMDEIDPALLNAFDVAGSDREAQRYVMYYGLEDLSQSPGDLSGNIKEYIYRFKINGENFRNIESTENPSTDSQYFMFDYDANKGGPWTRQEVFSHLLRERPFKFRFVFSGGASDTQLLVESTTVNIYVQDIFNIAYTLDYTHSTALRHSKYKYRIEKDKMKAKWFYFTDPHNNHSVTYYYNVYIGRWDITHEPLTRYLACYAVNPNEGNTKDVTETFSVTSSSSGSLNAGINIGNLIKVIDGKISVSNTTQRTVTTTYKIEPQSLFLGKAGYNYTYDYPLESVDKTKREVIPSRINNTAIEFTVMPMTNEFYQYLRSRGGN